MPVNRPGRLTLRNRREFDLVFKEGNSLSDALFIVHVREGGEFGVRLGLVVSRRIGQAVARNRMRRLIREVIRRHRGNIKDGVELVVIARSRARSLFRDRQGFARVEQSLVRLLDKAGVYAGGGAG